MKHLLSTALLCGVSVLAANAQIIVITDKDGLTHRYHADYVKDITFEQLSTQADIELNIESVEASAWNRTNIALKFTAGDCYLELDTYQPSALYFMPGGYTVNDSNNDFTVSPDEDYTFLELPGHEITEIASGSMDVSLSGDIYTFDLNMVTTEGKTVHGAYTGKITGFPPVLNYEGISMTYNENMSNPASNGFYYKVHDPAYKFEMSLDLFSSDDQIANGIYTFSDTGADGTAKSYINLYSPYNETTSFTDGTVTVEGSGASRVVTISGTLGIGLGMTAVFTGDLPLRPTRAINIDFTNIDVHNYGQTNAVITLTRGADSFEFDLYQASNPFLSDGTYVIGGSAPNYIGDDASYTKGTYNGNSVTIPSGQMVVSHTGAIYTISIDIVLSTGENIKGTYVGPLNKWSPVMEFTFSGIRKREPSDAVENGHYYVLNDEKWDIEAYVDIFSAGSAPDKGTYSIADTKANWTAAGKADIYYPINTNGTFTAGEMKVTATGLELDVTLSNGMVVKGVYTGALPQ